MRLGRAGYVAGSVLGEPTTRRDRRVGHDDPRSRSPRLDTPDEPTGTVDFGRRLAARQGIEILGQVGAPLRRPQPRSLRPSPSSKPICPPIVRRSELTQATSVSATPVVRVSDRPRQGVGASAGDRFEAAQLQRLLQRDDMTHQALVDYLRSVVSAQEPGMAGAVRDLSRPSTASRASAMPTQRGSGTLAGIPSRFCSTSEISGAG